MVKSEITPMMQQYLAAKKACPEALLLFRMGDFYELFLDDAITAAKVLGLTLTSRERGENATPMAGFPHHQLDSYLGKLILAGYRAAVCDQMEDPKTAKGLVKREVTRVVTAGTIIEESLLDPKSCNYLAGITDSDPTGIAWAELSTGKLYATTVAKSQLADELARIAPSECIFPEKAKEIVPAGLFEKMVVTKRPDWAFGKKTAMDTLLQHFKTTTLEGFGFTSPKDDTVALCAAGAVLDYLCETQKQSLEHLDTIVPYRKGAQLEIDLASRRSLEITRTIREGRRDGSLLAVLDQCVTAMGSRLLGDWVAAPLTDIPQIHVRLEAVGELQQNEPVTREVREMLKKVYDIERLLTRIIANRATPRDLAFIGRTLKTLPLFKQQLAESQSVLLKTLADIIDPCEEVAEKLEVALTAECPLTPREGGFICDGYNQELDTLRELQAGGKRWIAEYQKKESETLGLPNLKVGYNRVFGYYIEITNAKRAELPPTYIRKQTIKNAERYITPTLKEYEEKVLTAEERACELEYDLFVELRDAVSAVRSAMHRTASALAHLDVLAGFAVLARERNYCRPEIVEEPILNITDGRHPVLDVVLPNGTFVPNDAKSDTESGMIHLITGPNMAGKSTFIRQIALLTIMAQIGSYIPAKSAVIGIADRIFARVGASDELARGQSTFMVEMTETARILNMATPQSLVILDEIGRGTSTFDGVSLAWSIVEYMHDHIGSRTFFATHYHELTELAERLDRINNLNVAVREWNDEIVFLHKIIQGAADKSYGIHVARLAGVPKEVVKRADEILVHLENSNGDSPTERHILDRTHSDIDITSTDEEFLPKPNTLRQKLTPQFPDMPGETSENQDAIANKNKPPLLAKQILPGGLQLSLFGFMDHPVLNELRNANLNKLTPIEAIQMMAQWQQQLASD
ncbi:MAG: DNA mismatch repair protein MutS [Planctomycetaceae bacterium]|jgi:DNA mismatch repair protein MutS|nr:DNA mismatch repair protein MutS [Planctomycetaceae bacterium]